MHAPSRFRQWLTALRRAALPLLVLGLGGFVLSLPARHVHSCQVQAQLQPPPLPLKGEDALSQQLAFFTLGGIRSLVAEVLTLDATDAWLKRDWARAQRRWDSATTLCPRRENYWASAAYEMYANAAGDAQSDFSLSPAEQVNRFRGYIAEGERFLDAGILNNPHSWQLHVRRAEMHSNLYRRPQFSKAADDYAQAIRLGAPEYYKRFLFYSLCRVAGREQEAWRLGRALFNDPEHRLPSLVSLLFVLQHKITVPAAQALPPELLFRRTSWESPAQVRRNAIEELEQMLHNDLRFPINGIPEYLEKNR